MWCIISNDLFEAAMLHWYMHTNFTTDTTVQCTYILRDKVIIDQKNYQNCIRNIQFFYFPDVNSTVDILY